MNKGRVTYEAFCKFISLSSDTSHWDNQTVFNKRAWESAADAAIFEVRRELNARHDDLDTFGTAVQKLLYEFSNDPSPALTAEVKRVYQEKLALLAMQIKAVSDAYNAQAHEDDLDGGK